MSTIQLSIELQSALIRGLSDDSTLTAMLKQVVDRTAEVLEASACTIFIVDPGGRTATQRAGTGYQASFVDKGQCQVVPAGKVADAPGPDEKLGITGWILSTGKSFLARSPEELLNHPHRLGVHDPEQVPGEVLRLRTFLGVPLRGLHGEIIGVIKAERRAGRGANNAFTIKNQSVLETMARVAGKCVSYLETVRKGELEAAITAWTLDAISEASATEGELDSFLDLVVRVVSAAMRADSCGIYLCDESKKTLTQRAGTGSQAPRRVIRSYDLLSEDEVATSQARVGLTAWIAATGKSFYARNFVELHAHPHHRGQYDGYNFPDPTGTECGAFLGVPLQIGGTIIGVLKVENITHKGQPDGREFAPEARLRFDILAQEIALAITHMQEERKTRFEVITSAQETISEILRGGYDVPSLVQKVVKGVADLFNAGACALFLKDGNRLVQPQWAAHGWARKGPEVREYRLVDPSEIKDSPTADEKVGLTVWIAVKREKFVAKSHLELTKHPHHKGVFDQYNFPPNEKCWSFMGAPLLVDKEMVGVLKVETKRRDDGVTYFSEIDELVFDLIANSAAIAIANAKLLESQRLAEQIQNQSGRLLVELHDFMSKEWRVYETLNQAAKQLQPRSPNVAKIMEQYAQLLEPQDLGRDLEALARTVKQYAEFFEGSQQVSLLLDSFARALAARNLLELADLCSAEAVPGSKSLLEPRFFLHNAVGVLYQLYRDFKAILTPGSPQLATGMREQALVALTTAETCARTEVAQPEQSILLHLIASWRPILLAAPEVFRQVVSPYVTGSPISNSKVFFGRRDVVDWIMNHIGPPDQRAALLLHGPRRMGKSSILLQLKAGPLGEPLRSDPDRPLCPALVDLQGYNDHSTCAFFWYISNAIHASLPAGLQHCSIKPVLSAYETAPFAVFEEYLAGVSQALSQAESPTQLLLMVDEYEKIDVLVSDSRLDREIFDYIRHLIQHNPQVGFIFSGRRRLNELSKDFREFSRYTGVVTYEVDFLGPLDAEALITQPLAGQVIYEGDAIAELMRITHGHPLYLQELCDHLISAMNRRKTTNVVKFADIAGAMTALFYKQANYCETALDDLSEAVQVDSLSVLARRILCSMTDRAGACQPMTVSAAAAACSADAADIARALDRLQERRLVEPAGADGSFAFKPTMPLFCAFLAATDLCPD